MKTATKIALLIILLTLSTTYYVQAQSNCSCGEAFKNLVSKIESEYPGFKEKTKDKLIYATLKQHLAQEADTIAGSLCIDVLKKYTYFFKDGHIWLTYNKTESNDIAPVESVNINIDKFKKQILTFKNAFEGVWKDETYEVGVKQIGNQYIGFIIKSNSSFWKPKEIKFRIFPDGSSLYYTQDHSPVKGVAKFYHKSILFFEGIKSTFVKQIPAPQLNVEQVKEQVAELNGFYFKALTIKTSIIKLPSFGYEYVDLIEALIQKNLTLLENSENLIIDLRDNTGGTDASYYKILPYIMTNSIRNLGIEYLSTQTLINGLETYITGLKGQDEKQNDVERISKEIAILKANKGKFVNLSGKQVNTWEIKPALKSPRNVVILTNNMVASSAENLVMNARQSKKVKIIGTPTYGGLDYASGRYFDFGCSDYQLLLPTFRSLRLPDYPVDNIGLQPDIYLDKSVEDWIQFAVDYLENSYGS